VEEKNEKIQETRKVYLKCEFLKETGECKRITIRSKEKKWKIKFESLHKIVRNYPGRWSRWFRNWGSIDIGPWRIYDAFKDHYIDYNEMKIREKDITKHSESKRTIPIDHQFTDAGLYALILPKDHSFFELDPDPPFPWTPDSSGKKHTDEYVLWDGKKRQNIIIFNTKRGTGRIDFTITLEKSESNKYIEAAIITKKEESVIKEVGIIDRINIILKGNIRTIISAVILTPIGLLIVQITLNLFS
jgi:hypothetical protein